MLSSLSLCSNHAPVHRVQFHFALDPAIKRVHLYAATHAPPPAVAPEGAILDLRSARRSPESVRQRRRGSGLTYWSHPLGTPAHSVRHARLGRSLPILNLTYCPLFPGVREIVGAHVEAPVLERVQDEGPTCSCHRIEIFLEQLRSRQIVGGRRPCELQTH